MNKAQLADALDRIDRLYPNVTRPDYRDEVRRIGRALPPLGRTARQLADLVQGQRSVPQEQLLQEKGEMIRHLHDSLRDQALTLLHGPDWDYD